MKLPFRAADIILILLSTAGIALLSTQAYAQPSTDPVVRIESQGSQWIYPLDRDSSPVIPGSNAEMEVVIRDGQALVEWCDCCRRHICVSTGSISRSGEWIVCLPNEIFISIAGGGVQLENGVDDVVF